VLQTVLSDGGPLLSTTKTIVDTRIDLGEVVFDEDSNLALVTNEDRILIIPGYSTSYFRLSICPIYAGDIEQLGSGMLDMSKRQAIVDKYKEDFGKSKLMVNYTNKLNGEIEELQLKLGKLEMDRFFGQFVCSEFIDNPFDIYR